MILVLPRRMILFGWTRSSLLGGIHTPTAWSANFARAMTVTRSLRDSACRCVVGDAVAFELSQGTRVTWWKAVSVPIGDSGYIELEVQDGSTDRREIAYGEIDDTRQLRFAKAKFLGSQTLLSYTWDALPVLEPGDLVTLAWTPTC